MTSDNALLDGRMQETSPETYRDKELKTQIDRFLQRWGSFESVQRFVRKVGRPNTIREYLVGLDFYFRWLSS